MATSPDRPQLNASGSSTESEMTKTRRLNILKPALTLASLALTYAGVRGMVDVLKQIDQRADLISPAPLQAELDEATQVMQIWNDQVQAARLNHDYEQLSLLVGITTTTQLEAAQDVIDQQSEHEEMVNTLSAQFDFSTPFLVSVGGAVGTAAGLLTGNWTHEVEVPKSKKSKKKK